MKTKLFLAAMAAVAVIGCQKEPAGSTLADGQASFLKVDLRAAGSITKATDGGFVYGSPAENLVNTIHFWFFNAAGEAYAVQGTDNFLAITDLDFKEGNSSNVEEISDVVLVIKQSQAAPPTQMIAVLNAPSNIIGTKTKEQLEEDVVKASLTTDGAFIMSNAVYADGSVVVNATPIVEENIFTADELEVEQGGTISQEQLDALDITPIEVYVERVAAKVQVAAAEGLTLAKLPIYAFDEEGNITTDQMKDSKGSALYAKVLGWQITNITDEAPLLKSINPSWNNLGFTPWNVADLHRSYWAATTAEPLHKFTFNQVAGHNVGFDYYFENTKPATASNGVDVDVNGTFATPNTSENQAPQLLVAAQLVNEAGAPVSLAKWYDVLYTVEDLKVAMVGTLASKLYVEKGGALVSIGVGDVDFVQVEQTLGEKRYEVKMQPKEGVAYKTATGAAADAATLIGGVDPAQMWGNEDTKGYTYYYTTIEHLGTSYGIVRNHCYDIKITKVGGLGTPVYDPTKIITPEKPEEQEALNLATRINILSWHIVSQNVEL